MDRKPTAAAPMKMPTGDIDTGAIMALIQQLRGDFDNSEQ